MKIKMLLLAFTLSFAALPLTETAAQCPMCKMAAESNLKDGGTAGKGLNKGILYMFMTPYLVIGTIGYIWYRNRPRDEEEEAIG